MLRSIVVTRNYEKDCKELSLFMKAQIDSVLFGLQKNPVDSKLSVKKLLNIHPPVWRVRIGSFRLLYTFDEKQLILLKFKHRKDIYKNL